MIPFRKVTLEDKTWIDPLYQSCGYQSCEYTFANLFMWCEQYQVQIANVGGFLVAASSGEKMRYSFPVGQGDFEGVVREMMMDAKERGIVFKMQGLVEEARQTLEQAFPNLFVFSSNRDYSDYLYTAESLINLTGKKLSAKRNHINNFVRNNSDWSFEPMTNGNIRECQRMNIKWCRAHGCGSDKSQKMEFCAVNKALENFEALGLTGGMIRLNGEVIAFSVGERLTEDTFVVHIEKTFSEIQGAYPMINREFARYAADGFTYINREEDLGVAGLRKAKLSYNPAIILDKYEAVLQK